MKLKITAAAAAVMLLSACSGKAPEPQTTQSMEEAFASITETSQTSETALAPETEAPEETETEKVSVTKKEGKKKYVGHRYALFVNEDVWENKTAEFNDVRKFAVENDLMDKEQSKRLGFLMDAFFSHKEDDSVTLCVMSAEIGDEGQLDYETVEPIYREEFESSDSVEYLGSEKLDINGVSGIALRSKQKSDNSRMDMYFFWNKGRQIIISYSVPDEEYDKYLPDLEEFINEIEFK